MIGLHGIRTDKSIVLFYGSPDYLRCTDRYHNGYSSERGQLGVHHECASAIFNNMDFDYYATRLCICECDATGRVEHYFPANYELREASICRTCALGEHPTPVARNS